jgi:hypothetical protein
MIEKEKITEIENKFESRMYELDIKYDSKKYREEQAAYFSGVMQGWITMSLIDKLPPYWVLCILSGRCIVDKERHKELIKLFQHEASTSSN